MTLSAAQVAPQKPWQSSPKEMAPTFLLLLASLAASVAVVAITPMKGKLAYAFLFFIFGTASLSIRKWRIRGRAAAADAIVSSIALTGATLVFTPVISILATTISHGVKGLHWSLFTQTMFSASYQDPISAGGLLHALVGTLYLILISMILSVPMGILTALYLTEIKGPGANFIQFIVQAMSGVPSVVAGLFIFASIIVTTPIKASAIAGAFALSILMIPTVTRTAQEVLLLVPNDLREAGQALGATQWKTVATIVVPAARNGLITATILGVARIAGETAPLLFTIGGSDKLNWNPFKDYQGALPFYVWKGLLMGTPESIQRAWTGILILLILVLLLFVAARTLGGRRMKSK
ncbi:MAG: phosphate ABC transporter permease PstA [Actinomycetes bacterium]